MSKLAVIIEEVQEKLREANLLGSTLGHVGDGNFHATVLYSEAERAKAEAIILETQRRGIELEGTITGEHGVGLALRDLLNEELGGNAVDMMRRVSRCSKIISASCFPSVIASRLTRSLDQTCVGPALSAKLRQDCPD